MADKKENNALLSFYDDKELKNSASDIDYGEAANLILNQFDLVSKVIKRILPDEPDWNIKVALRAILSFKDFAITEVNETGVIAIRSNAAIGELRVGERVWCTQYEAELEILGFTDMLFRPKNGIPLVHCVGGFYDLSTLRSLSSQEDALAPKEITMGGKTYTLTLKADN